MFSIFLHIFRKTSRFIDVFSSKCEQSSTSIWYTQQICILSQIEIHIIHQQASISKAYFYFIYRFSTCFVPSNENKQRLFVSSSQVYLLTNSNQQNFYVFKLLVTFYTFYPFLLKPSQILLFSISEQGVIGRYKQQAFGSELPLQSRAAL